MMLRSGMFKVYEHQKFLGSELPMADLKIMGVPQGIDFPLQSL